MRGMIIEKRWRWGLCLAMASSLVAIGPEESLASLTVRHWGAQAGIPEETVSALLASGDGYVWLATNHGLARFDGSRAQVFRLGDMFRPKGTGSCSSNSLNALLAGKKGQIWVGAGSGCVFQIRRDRFGGFASFEVMAMESPTVGRQDSAVQLLLESSDGEQVEVGRVTGLSRIRTSAAESVAGRLAPPSTSLSLEERLFGAPEGSRLTHMARGADGVLWGVSGSRLFSRRPGGGWSSPTHWAGKPGAGKPGVGKPGAAPLSLLVDRSGAVWIGSTKGLFRWKDGVAREWTVVDGLPHPRVMELLEDRNGCIWMGSLRAVARWCGARIESMELGGAQEEVFSTIAEDPQGNIWLGGVWGNLYRLSHPIFQTFTQQKGAPESHFTGVTTDRDGQVWGSTRESGLIRIDGGRVVQRLTEAGISETQAMVAHPAGGVLAAGAKGIFWAGRGPGTGPGRGPVQPIALAGPIRYGGMTGLAWEDSTALLLANNEGHFRLRRRAGEKWLAEPLDGPPRVRQWAKDPGGKVWAISQYSGLHWLEGVRYRPAENAFPERSRAWYSLASDREGLLWMGTLDGLEIYSPAERRFLTKHPILMGDQIFHISEDKFGKIWCATRMGLVRLDRAQALAVARGGEAEHFFVERFGNEQTLPTTNFGLATSSTGAMTADGRIWVPGLLGLVSLQPADFERVPPAPMAVLRQLTLDGARQDLNRALKIPPGGKTVEFQFQTVRLDALGGDFCRVRLEGFDRAWRTCNEARTQQYPGLPPGSYQFVVQTSSQGGAWNGRVLRVSLEIEPALLQRGWVQAMTILALVLGVGFVLWRRQKQLLDRNRWLQEKVEERTATLAKATEAAESANRAKTEFLATMSHEIRTPMNGVLGTVQILEGSPLDAEQKKLVEVIRQSGEDLVSIVDDILCLAKVEAGKIRLERAPVEVYGLGESLLALFQAKADAKGVGMRLVVEPGVPRLILSDPQRMRQILLNLVGNAIKFTERGEVRLRVSADASLITFHVEDTGMGISPAALLTLFEPFVQADSSTTRRFGGSGLGLSIVRRLVEAMGGRVSVESEVAVGSVFRVTLPLEALEECEPEEQVAVVAHTESLAQLGLRVLLVEDNPVNQMIGAKMLSRLGCAVTVANHGQEALEKLQTATVDLVLMDCQMPELDGYAATRAIRARGGEFARLPIVALTASAMEDERQRCLDAGMDDFLSKPIMLLSLETALRRWSPPA